MRFILGFIFFGLLFYALSVYFPEAFQTLTGWAAGLFDFIREQFERLTGAFHKAPEAPR